MRAGSLDRAAYLLRPTQVGETALGEPLYEDTRLLTLWVSLSGETGGEDFVAGQRIASRSVTFQSRYFSDLQATDKIECEGVTYEVTGWREIGRRRGLEISARALR